MQPPDLPPPPAYPLPVDSKAAHTHLEAVANKKGLNRYLIVSKDGKLEQTHFLKAWIEDFKGRRGRPSLRDSHLIKLKALQLVVSLGKEWVNTSSEIALIATLAQRSGLIADPELHLKEAIDVVALSILNQEDLQQQLTNEEAAVILNKTFTGALEEYKITHQSELSQYPEEILLTQEKVRESVRRILPEAPSRETADAELPAPPLPKSDIEPHKVEVVTSSGNKWSNTSKTFGVFTAGILALGTGYYALRSQDTGSGETVSAASPTSPTSSVPTLIPSASPSAAPSVPTQNVHPSLSGHNFKPVEQDQLEDGQMKSPTDASNVANLAKSLKEYSVENENSDVGSAESISLPRPATSSQKGFTRKGIVAKIHGISLASLLGVIGIGYITRKQKANAISHKPDLEVSKQKQVQQAHPEPQEEQDEVEQEEVSKSERYREDWSAHAAKGEKIIQHWIKTNDPILEHIDISEDYKKFVNAVEPVNLQEVLSFLHQFAFILEEPDAESRRMLLNIQKNDQMLRRLSDICHARIAVAQQKETCFERRLHDPDVPKEMVQVLKNIQWFFDKQTVIPIDYKIALLEAATMPKNLNSQKLQNACADCLEWIQKIQNGNVTHSEHRAVSLMNLLVLLNNDYSLRDFINWQELRMDMPKKLYSSTVGMKEVIESLKATTSIELDEWTDNYQERVSFEQACAPYLPEPEKTLAAEGFTLNHQQNIYVKSQWEKTKNGFILKGQLAVIDHNSTLWDSEPFEVVFDFSMWESELQRNLSEEEKAKSILFIISGDINESVSLLPDTPNGQKKLSYYNKSPFPWFIHFNKQSFDKAIKTALTEVLTPKQEVEGDSSEISDSEDAHLSLEDEQDGNGGSRREEVVNGSRLAAHSPSADNRSPLSGASTSLSLGGVPAVSTNSDAQDQTAEEIQSQIKAWDDSPEALRRYLQFVNNHSFDYKSKEFRQLTWKAVKYGGENILDQLPRTILDNDPLNVLTATLIAAMARHRCKDHLTPDEFYLTMNNWLDESQPSDLKNKMRTLLTSGVDSKPDIWPYFFFRFGARLFDNVPFT